MASKSGKSTKRQAESAAGALEEIESLGERIAAWVGQNPVPVLGAGLVILLAAAAWGLISSHLEGRRVDASAALAEVQGEYRSAMGADPSVLGLAEPADPETAQRVRSEFVDRYEQVARDYDGTAAGALARLEAGALQQTLGRLDEALAIWQETAEELDADNPVRALVLVRIAAAYEAEARWIDAAESYEKAGAIERYPVRYAALAEAARCFDQGGARERALAAFGRIGDGAAAEQVPEYIAARMRELRALEDLE